MNNQIITLFLEAYSEFEAADVAADKGVMCAHIAAYYHVICRKLAAPNK